MTQIIEIDCGYVKAFLLLGKSVVLVDTGIKGSKDKIEKKLIELGYTFSDIALIVITHNHVDHVGSLVDILNETDALVVSHDREAKTFEAGTSEIVGRHALTRIGIGLSDLVQTHKPVEADVDLLFTTEFDLIDYGIDGKLIHTPGHTYGSLSVIVDDRVIVGDLLMGHIPFLKGSLFPIASSEADMIESVQKLLKMEVRLFYTSHGSFLTKEDVYTIIEKKVTL